MFPWGYIRNIKKFHGPCRNVEVRFTEIQSHFFKKKSRKQHCSDIVCSPILFQILHLATSCCFFKHEGILTRAKIVHQSASVDDPIVRKP